MNCKMAQMEDIEAVTRLRMTYFDHVYAGIMTVQEREQLFQTNVEYLKEELNRSLFISIVEEDGIVVASAYMSVFRMAANLRSRCGRFGEIYGVYTDEAYRRRGFADCNIRRLIQAAGELGLSHLQLEASPEGENLYLRNGFVNENATYTRMHYEFEKGIVL